MYGAKEHLLFDTVRHPHGAGDDAHREDGLLLHRMDKQVGVDILPAVDPEVVAELIAGPGCVLVGPEFGIDRNLPGQFVVGLLRKGEEFRRADCFCTPS